MEKKLSFSEILKKYTMASTTLATPSWMLELGQLCPARPH